MSDRADDEGRRDAAAARLASGESLRERVALVVAHPDDESLWAAGPLMRARDLVLVMATDGAPHEMADAARLGLATRSDYAAARSEELDRALGRLGAAPARVAFGHADQEAALAIGRLADALTERLAGCAIVATHPYEGGHPDHDALALGVALAVARLARRGEAPAHVEFACYHEVGGKRRFGRFWPDPCFREHARKFSASEHGRVAGAVEAHRSQAGVVGDWRPDAERWRAAPPYDFTAPPPPGRALYDRFGWAMTSARWRALAAETIAAEHACA